MTVGGLTGRNGGGITTTVMRKALGAAQESITITEAGIVTKIKATITKTVAEEAAGDVRNKMEEATAGEATLTTTPTSDQMIRILNGSPEGVEAAGQGGIDGTPTNSPKSNFDW